ncbi:MAG: hypothetical protein IBX55_13055 [Methyloprofundus sp.]|nr:hypothetical protein [Methyloprofundus sp.]
MKLANAIKKIEKLGHTVEQNGGIFRSVINGHALTFCSNGPVNETSTTAAISTCGLQLEQERDSMSDYFPETYHDNLAQALRFIKAA